VDSGSSDSFIDSVFIQTQHLPAYGIPPIKLRLIDGTSNSVILQALDLQICFPTRESQNLTFYVTPLDQSCTIVLGYCWLTHYNPSIDWVLGSIFFRQLLQHESKSSPSVETFLSSAPLLKLPDSVLDIPKSVPPVEPRKPPKVTSLMQLRILAQASLKAQIVSNSGSHSLRSLVIPQPLPRQRST